MPGIELPVQQLLGYNLHRRPNIIVAHEFAGVPPDRFKTGAGRIGKLERSRVGLFDVA